MTLFSRGRAGHVHRRRAAIRVLLVMGLLAGVSGMVLAQSGRRAPIDYRPDARYRGQTIWDIAKVKEENADIGLWALIVSKAYDSTVDVPACLAMLDEWAAEINRMLAGRTRDMDKLLAVRTFLYESGPWNGGRVWTYDTAGFDIHVDRPELRLLSHYMRTRKGNCVSMPTLFLALMERVDPNLRLFGATIPMHLFCRYHDRQTKDQFNVETTVGGLPSRNEHLLDIMPVNQEAIDKGTYLRDLTRKEFIADLIGILEGQASAAGDVELAMRYSDLMIRTAPKHIVGYINKAGNVARMWDSLHAPLDRGKLVTEEQWAEIKRLGREMKSLRAKIDGMGWQPVPDDWADRYNAMIRAAWSRRAALEAREAAEAREASDEKR